ncbi:LuxR C-terminal-related transcriptional regulator [Thermoactinospora rubra]|uniref:LuxR C-terminal-related transcriptional regulator n=1 Tax=Thermoactinospora rubra TaxID=1088767 RepID=UPI001301A147|nr:LuxR C-terminal-related transcriptional regulator [Thermoactinospora rubra]
MTTHPGSVLRQAARLPKFGTSFVGRDQELASVATALQAGRMVTLTGPGGSGKTRLAAVAGNRARQDWPDGVHWIGLEETFDDTAVAAVVANALGITASPGTEQLAVVNALDGTRSLLVLDNCEQVRHGVGGLVEELLYGTPTIGVLATSRTPVGVAGERLYRVGPLTLEDALSLFCARAESAGARLSGSGAARRICDRVDRLPLALELAAGWTTTLSTDEIVDLLARPLELLDDSESRAPYRLRSLAGSVQWSYDLLGERHRSVFRRLSVFRRGFTVEQAVAVCGDAKLEAVAVLRCLRDLVDACLVIADPEASPARFSMLDVIAAFARERLVEADEETAVRNRHLDTYRDLLERQACLREADKDVWRATLAPEYGNLVAAIEWGLSGGRLSGARAIATGLAWFWHLESRRPEGVSLLTAVVHAGGGERSAAQARAEVALALVADTAAPDADHRDALIRALEVATEYDDEATARLARILLALRFLADDPRQARRLAQENAEAAVSAGDVFNACASQVLLGILHCLDDDHVDAIRLLEPVSATLRDRADRGVAATALGYLASAYARIGSLDRAIEIAEQAVDCARPLHDLHRIGHVSVILAELVAMRGRIADAYAAIEAIDQLMDRQDGPALVPGWELTHARIAAWEGRHTDAIDWCLRGIRLARQGAVDHRVSLAETQLELASALRLTGDLERATAALSEAAAVAEHTERPRLRAEVQEQSAFLAPDAEAAYHQHQEALRIRSEAGLTLDVIDSLEHLAAAAVTCRSPAFAVILAAAAHAARDEYGYAARRVPLASSVSDLLADPAHAEAVRHGRELRLDAVTLARRMRGPRDRPDRGWASLTPTESTVAQLAAEGLSNPQIAERLFISRGTVKTHLAHIYAKLGVTNRTELAAAHARIRRAHLNHRRPDD